MKVFCDTKAEAVLPGHSIWLELSLSTGGVIHVSRFGGEKMAGVRVLDITTQVITVFHHGRLIQMLQPDVLMALLQPGVNKMADRT
jgi:hypothetical protein